MDVVQSLNLFIEQMTEIQRIKEELRSVVFTASGNYLSADVPLGEYPGKILYAVESLFDVLEQIRINLAVLGVGIMPNAPFAEYPTRMLEVIEIMEQIRSAINQQGVSTPPHIEFSQFPARILQIEGGGGSGGTSDSWFRFTENVGIMPTETRHFQITETVIMPDIDSLEATDEVIISYS